MRIVIIFFASLFLGLFPLEGFAAVQNSLPDTIKEINYDTSKNLKVPELNKKILENFKNDSSFDYSEAVQQDNWWTTFKNWLWELWLKVWYWLVGDYEANGIVAFLVHTLPYVIIGTILFFIVWLFYKLNPGATLFGSQKKPEIYFSEEEEIIRSKDISELMEKSLAAKDYRLAIRYYYLLILQKLTQAEIISYASDKTNSQYISEINSEAIKSGFQKATNLYDHVWYGSFEVTESDFSKAQPTFILLQSKIPNPIV